MLKQIFTLFLCSFLVVSCTFFEKSYKKEKILEVDTIVDFSSVDAFPLFPDCKDIPSRKKQQICFQLEMSQHIYASLKQYSLNASDVINDTILIKLKVDNSGKTSISSVKISKEAKNLFPEFDSLLIVSVQNLPNLEPAIKRNMPVTTEFTLPIILKN